MDYIISDTHFLHDNIWLYDLSRVVVMYNQIKNMTKEQLYQANISNSEQFISMLKDVVPQLDDYFDNQDATQYDNFKAVVNANKQFIREIGDKLMLDNWNKVVTRKDTVYHLGDLSMATTSQYSDIANVLSQLNGKIYLILGNHDNRQLINKLDRDGYIEILSDVGYRKKFNHRVYFLSHYGIDIGGYNQLRDYVKETDSLPKNTTVSIHGHIHEDDYLETYKFNVSVDNKLSYTVNNYKLGTPLLFDALDKYVSENLLREVKENIADEDD